MLRDKDIREGVFDYQEEKYGKVRFFEDLTMGKSRADIVMVTEEALFGVEIKSDADTYVRLERQVKDYDRFFDYNILVVGSTHGIHASEHVPEYWGIVTVEETVKGLDFYELRQPSKKKKARLRTQLHLLWRRELLHIQTSNKLHKYANKRRSYVETYIMETLGEEECKKQLIEELFERDYTIFEDQES